MLLTSAVGSAQQGTPQGVNGQGGSRDVRNVAEAVHSVTACLTKQPCAQVAQARMKSEMYAVMTTEQKAQLAAERQLREQKRQERRFASSSEYKPEPVRIQSSARLSRRRLSFVQL